MPVDGTVSEGLRRPLFTRLSAILCAVGVLTACGQGSSPTGTADVPAAEAFSAETSPAPELPLGWSLLDVMRQVPDPFPNEEVEDVDCPTRDWCLVLTDRRTFEFADGRLAEPALIAADAGNVPTLTERVSCSSPSFCILNAGGSFRTYDGESWTLRVPAGTFFGECPRDDYCFAVDSDARTLRTFDAGQIQQQALADLVPESYPGGGASGAGPECAAGEDFCVAYLGSVSSNHTILAWTASGWSVLQNLPSGTYAEPDFGCGPGPTCMLLAPGKAFLSADGGEFVPIESPSSPAVDAYTLSCGGPRLCLAVGVRHDLWIWNGRSWTTEPAPDYIGTSTRIHCLNEELCLAVVPDNDTHIAAYRRGAPADPQPAPSAPSAGQVTISLDGFGPFDWGSSQADAEEALGAGFLTQDLGLGCAQGQLPGFDDVVFAIEDGVVTGATVFAADVESDTGITVGDPVEEVTTQYPDAVAEPDPSDALSTRYRVVDDGRSAQFLSSDGTVVEGMAFGLESAVGEAPCV
ncbi:hypothetical protein SAMN06893097_104243 [Geodermatophilus sabuli]|uniref:Uncharacterized protein n=2 Tax=Geodermatophilus sabuli TaxID=1564158 RepID=A0A285EBM5_9ACTN|nr:hypothetical protein SAMN06893097_104243 [Geodermatophilus sabuli]